MLGSSPTISESVGLGKDLRTYISNNFWGDEQGHSLNQGSISTNTTITVSSIIQKDMANLVRTWSLIWSTLRIWFHVNKEGCLWLLSAGTSDSVTFPWISPTHADVFYDSTQVLSSCLNFNDIIVTYILYPSTLLLLFLLLLWYSTTSWRNNWGNIIFIRL